jgi:hypothetical protein
MRVTVLILGLALSFVVFLHTCSVLGLSGIFAGDPSQLGARSGILMAALLIMGGAFAFSFPRVSIASFLLATLAGIGRSTRPEDSPDLKFWCVFSFALAALSVYNHRRILLEVEHNAMLQAEEAERHAELLAALRGED